MTEPADASSWARVREGWRTARGRARAAWERARERAAAARASIAASRARLAAARDAWLAAHPKTVRWTRISVHAALLLLLAYAAFAYGRHVKRVYGGSTVDDAGITYAYAESLATGDGLRMTPGEAPTEGFSNPLQVLLLAPVARFVDDLDPAAKWINIGLVAMALALLCAFVYAQLRSVARLFAIVPLGLAVYWCGFNYWVAAGLEGGILAALQIVSLLAVHYGPRHRAADVTLGIVAGLLAWTRPEGIVYGGIAIAVRFFASPSGRRWLAPAVFAGLVAALYLFRWTAFRDVVPNTFWAKVPGRDLWWSLTDEESPGRKYLTGFLRERWWYFAIPLWAAAPAWRGAQALTAAAVGQLLFAILFPVYVGGDWMAEWRLLQPMMGPMAVLGAVGLVAVLGTETRLLRSLGRSLSVLALFGVAALLAFNPPGWKDRRKQVTAHHDVDLRDVRKRVPGYHKLAGALRLPRPPLIGDVDVGGTSYRSGLEILDIGGLSDRAMALARARQSAVGPDYLFGERLPEVLHLQASWLHSTGYQKLSGFRTLYRELGGSHLRDYDIGGMLAVRADLLDPAAAPARPLTGDLGSVRLTGLTALPVPDGTVLVLHGRQLNAGRASPAAWKDASGRKHVAAWNAGFALQTAGPIGTPLVAVAVLPAGTRLPLTLGGADVRVEQWPTAEAGDRNAAALSRIPLLRIAGRGMPSCDPDRLLDPKAPAVHRARGAGFVARVCGALPSDLAERWREAAMDAAEDADDPDDRFEAAAATLGMGLPQWLSTRVLLERTRPAHAPFDEVLDAWAREDFVAALDSPGRAATGLRMLLGARRWSDVVLHGLSFGVDRPEIAGPVCTAARRLGLRSDAVAPGLDCGAVPDVEAPRVVRQSFESPDDPLLRYVDSRVGTMRPTPMRRVHSNQREIVGGHGCNLINSYGDLELRDLALGAVVWGPLPWQGRRFGALLAGGRNANELHVAVEGLVDGRWTTLARLTSPADDEALLALIADLGPHPASQVRVQVIDASRAGWGHIIADGLTFIDDPAGRAAEPPGGARPTPRPQQVRHLGRTVAPPIGPPPRAQGG